MGAALEFEAKIDSVKTKQNTFGETEATITLKVVSGDAEDDFGPLLAMHGEKLKLSLAVLVESKSGDASGGF